MNSRAITNSQYTKRYKQNFSEIAFRNQIQKAEKGKLLKSGALKELKREEYISTLKKILNLNDLTKSSNSNWESNSFDTDLIFKEETPLIKLYWEDTLIESCSRGVEINQIIYRSKDKLNTQHFSVEMNLTCYLVGESSCWIFNRVDEYFDEYSVVVKLSKEEKSQKVFVSLGTFAKDAQDNLVFRIFVKEQLIDFSKTKNKFYSENDICFVRVFIIDTCDDMVLVKAYINDSKTENVINSSFFLPIIVNRRVMIAGNGEKCIIKTFIAKNIDLTQRNLRIPKPPKQPPHESINNIIVPDDRKRDNCCTIY